jgi:FixJ family two-component response regulator
MAKVLPIPLVCIIDDDESVRESVSDLVQSLGYKTATFASAEEYLQSDHVENASCVITDVRMPGMSGVELQGHLRASGQKTPIIFITSFPSEDIGARVLKAGAFGFFRKPFDDDRLVECLNNALACPPG